MTKSIWTAEARNIESYKKFKPSSVMADVIDEFKTYHSFDGVHKGVLLHRFVSAVRQSLRVRGINALLRMRKSLLSYEKQLTNEIRILQKIVNDHKNNMKMCSINMDDEDVKTTKVIRYIQFREYYLEAKIRLESKILERKNLREQLKTGSSNFLKE